MTTSHTDKIHETYINEIYMKHCHFLDEIHLYTGEFLLTGEINCVVSNIITLYPTALYPSKTVCSLVCTLRHLYTIQYSKFMMLSIIWSTQSMNNVGQVYTECHISTVSLFRGDTGCYLTLQISIKATER